MNAPLDSNALKEAVALTKAAMMEARHRTAIARHLLHKADRVPLHYVMHQGGEVPWLGMHGTVPYLKGMARPATEAEARHNFERAGNFRSVAKEVGALEIAPTQPTAVFVVVSAPAAARTA